MKTNHLISILIAEDHNVIRQGLSSLLKSEESFRVSGEAKNGREAVAMALADHPDVILMDISMPLLNGIDATRQILAANPDARIVILSAHTEDEYFEEIIKVGAFAFLNKDIPTDVLFGAIRKAADRAFSFSPSIIKRLNRKKSRSQRRDGLVKFEFPTLTPREREVLQLVAEGLSNKQSALELHISIKTVDRHRQSVMDKLDIHGTAGLTRYAISAGVIEVGARLTGAQNIFDAPPE